MLRKRTYDIEIYVLLYPPSKWEGNIYCTDTGGCDSRACAHWAMPTRMQQGHGVRLALPGGRRTFQETLQTEMGLPLQAHRPAGPRRLFSFLTPAKPRTQVCKKRRCVTVQPGAMVSRSKKVKERNVGI